jgi:dihydroorotate dehydrogenase
VRGWRRTAYRAVRPLLFLADPEAAHHGALRTLAVAGSGRIGRHVLRIAAGVPAAEAAPVELLGLRFRNRIGLGAGFDKDGVAIRGWAALGFGFIELGTVTPRPQPGNPRPRLYRLVSDEALVNRMGFNNAGADAVARRIAAARPHLPGDFIIGVNIGRNRAGDADDYPAAARALAGTADYLVMNVSSPNTPGLRDLQEPTRLLALLDAVADVARTTPLLVKLAADLDGEARAAVLEALSSAPASGLVLSNTTTDRTGVRSPHAAQAGGLSGRPLRRITLDAVRQARAVTGGRLVIVASGGIGSAADATQLLEAGADLVQLWTGLVYAGPGLIGETADAAGA